MKHLQIRYLHVEEQKGNNKAETRGGKRFTRFLVSSEHLYWMLVQMG